MMFWKKKQSPYVVATRLTASKGKLDEHSETWIYIADYAKAEIEKLRVKNDSPNNTEVQTAVIRGRIKALKMVLDLTKENKGILSELAD